MTDYFTAGEAAFLLGSPSVADFDREIAPQLELIAVVPRSLGRPTLHYSRASVEKYFGRAFTEQELKALGELFERRRKAARDSAAKARRAARMPSSPVKRAGKTLRGTDPSTGKPWVRLSDIPVPARREVARLWKAL